MSTLYMPVRLATCIISGVLLLLSIMDLVHELNRAFYDKTTVASLSIMILVLFICVYGSYRHDRAYLYTFSLIAIIAIIVGFVGHQAIYGSLGTCIALVVLALVQSEMLKRGHH